jgi:hypothetical protein
MNMPATAASAQSPSSNIPVLLPTQLLPGDIIITAAPTFISRAVRWATDETVSHALLHCRDGKAVEANPNRGVTYGPLHNLLSEVTHAAVLRHKYATPQQCKVVVEWALAQAGKPYDRLGAARIGLQPGARTAAMRYSPHGIWVKVIHDAAASLSEAGHDSSFFCSELIAKAYVEAGTPLTDSPAYLTSPGRLLTASPMRYIGDVRSLA